jgi:hypothetical protein
MVLLRATALERRAHLRRQILGLHPLTWCHHREPVTEVLELTDIARKRLNRNKGNGLGGELFDLHAQ